MTQDEALQTICIHASDIVDVCTHLRSLESKAPQWLRHEGGAMPEGVREKMLLYRYDDESYVYSGLGLGRDWRLPLWYMLIPTAPAPPKMWTVTTKGDSTILGKNGNHVCGLSCFTPAEQMAIVDALNKQVQGGGE